MNGFANKIKLGTSKRTTALAALFSVLLLTSHSSLFADVRKDKKAVIKTFMKQISSSDMCNSGTFRRRHKTLSQCKKQLNIATRLCVSKFEKQLPELVSGPEFSRFGKAVGNCVFNRMTR